MREDLWILRCILLPLNWNPTIIMPNMKEKIWIHGFSRTVRKSICITISQGLIKYQYSSNLIVKNLLIVVDNTCIEICLLQAINYIGHMELMVLKLCSNAWQVSLQKMENFLYLWKKSWRKQNPLTGVKGQASLKNINYII